MKCSMITIIIIIYANINIFAQNTENSNKPVAKSGTLSCNVITPLSIDPSSSKDYINWPTIPIGSKYFLGESPRQNADFNSIYTLSGEPGSAVEISVTQQTLKENVEISYRFKGTPFFYLGVEDTPLISFVDNRTVINLSPEGEFYLHIVYDWVWAHNDATKGIKKFTQQIYANYSGL